MTPFSSIRTRGFAGRVAFRQICGLLAIVTAFAAGEGEAWAQDVMPLEPPSIAQPPSGDPAADLDKAKAAALERTKAGRFAEAAPFAELALALTRSIHGADAVESAVAAHNLGFLLRRADRIAEATQHLELALSIYERASPAVHEDVGNLVGELGQIYVRAGRGEEVVGIYQRLIERARREGYAGHVGAANLHNNLAFLLRGLKRAEESAGHWQKAIAIYQAQTPQDNEAYRLALEGLADRYQGLGKTDETRALLTEAMARLRSGGQGEGRAAFWLLNRLARLEHASGRYMESRAHSAAALAIAERRPPEAAADQVEPLNDMARSDRALGNFAAAEEGYKRALALLTRPADMANAGIITDNLASLYGQTNRFEEAEIHHKRAIELLGRALGRDHREVGQAVANFGVMLKEAGRHAEAEPLLRRGLAIAEAQPQTSPVALGIVHDNLASLLRVTGRHGEALTHIRRALALFEGALPPTHPTLGTTRNNLGRWLLDLGYFAEAETQLRASLQLAENLHGPQHVSVAVRAANLGECYTGMGELQKARDLLSRALAALEQSFGPVHPKLIPTLTALGRLELAQGGSGEAVRQFERAVSIELASRSRLGIMPLPAGDQMTSGQGAFNGLLEALWTASGGRNAAMTARAMEIGQWNTMTPAAMALAALGARAGADDPALRTLTRERQDLAAGWQAADKALTSLFSEAAAGDAATETALRDRLAATEERLGAIDKELAAKFPRYGDLAKPTPLSVAELRGLLQPNEAALQYVVNREATHLWLVTKTQSKWVRLAAGRADLLGHVKALRCGLDREEWNGEGRKRCLALLGLPETTRLRARDPLPFPAERAQALFALLFGPVRQTIAGRDLMIVASGPLTSLPFHALVTQKPAAAAAGEAPDFARIAWLGRRNTITMLPSLASLKSLRQFARTSRASSPFIGIGNPLLTGEDGSDRSAWARQSCDAPALAERVADITSASSPMQVVRGGVANAEALRRQTPLPETADELCSVAKFVGAERDAVLLGAHATETRVKAMSKDGRLAGARILHLATHGLLAGEAETFLNLRAEPALILTPPDAATEEDDGLLTATEVATLKLDADWVILSACNTAAGDQAGAEALSGLARAFFYAGARSLMVSHWAVDSDATVKLITGAVAAMTKDRRATQAEALRRSMAALIESGGSTAHPAFWAPFVVVGGSGAAALPAVQAVAPRGQIVEAAATLPSAEAAQIAVPPLPAKAPAFLKQARVKPATAKRQSPRPARTQPDRPVEETSDDIGIDGFRER